MTVSEVGKALSFTGPTWHSGKQTTEDSAGNSEQHWRIGYSSPYNSGFAETRTIDIVFVDGKVDRFTQTRDEMLDHEPDVPGPDHQAKSAAHVMMMIAIFKLNELAEKLQAAKH